MNKKALIIGISGQDGAFLAKHLLDNNYIVYGTSRDKYATSFGNLRKLNIFERVTIFSMSIIDYRSVVQLFVELKPDEVYNLSGQSSVGLSYEMPFDTHQSISVGTLNILEIIRLFKFNLRYYNASSSECFGDTQGLNASENSPFRPKSPYGVAKSSAFWQVSNYRESYDLFACSGILFNHESYFRPNRFVTQKIILSAIEIYNKKKDFFEIGNIDIVRDWGWAPEYVEAMHLILQQDKADDFIIATGTSISLKEFINITFSYFNLDYNNYLIQDKNLLRPSDILISKADNTKAKKILGWESKTKINDIIGRMIEYQLTGKLNF
ncbi:GDP-mannose 4,6-dehydratase [Aquirufa novilacunae]|uniref:GDP-mannose 4,6-dehydratase n=1 Tax=Aquirufa novilacunae TaxID=3139305 RepID=A0ABW8U0N8_9BACT